MTTDLCQHHASRVLRHLHDVTGNHVTYDLTCIACGQRVPFGASPEPVPSVIEIEIQAAELIASAVDGIIPYADTQANYLARIALDPNNSDK